MVLDIFKVIGVYDCGVVCGDVGCIGFVDLKKQVFFFNVDI